MGKDSLSDRLKRFEDRLKAERSGGSGSRGGHRGEFTQGSLAWRMVIELVVGMVLGLAIGFGLDSLLGTRPVFLVLFVLLGFAGGVRTMMRTADEVRRGHGEGARLGGDGKRPGDDRLERD